MGLSLSFLLFTVFGVRTLCQEKSGLRGRQTVDVGGKDGETGNSLNIHRLMQSSQPSHEVDIDIISILQLKKLKSNLLKVTQLVQ